MRSAKRHKDLAVPPGERPAVNTVALVPKSGGRIIPLLEQEHCSAAALEGVLRHRFSYNGETHSLGTEIDWLENPSRDVEWHILLHKFYFAPGLARQYATTGDERYRNCFENLVRSWVDQTSPGFIAADVTARRVQNWIYAWYLIRQQKSGGPATGFEETFFRSLEMQVNFVCDNLAAKRNHRTMGLYAIFLAAVALPGLDTGARWRRLAVEQMLQNIQADLLPDGVHCELSTDYHHIVLRSYLLFYRLAKMNNINLPVDISGKLCQALDFAMHIHRPDGKIPALSDSDSCSYHELLAWGSELFGREDYKFVATSGAAGTPPGASHIVFSDSGYAILRSPWRNSEEFADARYLVFDCGPIGAGNHGHLDALNIEIAAYGKPLIIDPGRYTYDEHGETNWRARFRKTSAHNTVTINDCDQAIYRRRGAKYKILNPKPACTFVKSRLHDEIPYLHGFVESPNYQAVHHRHIWFADNRYWVILDRIVAEEAHRYKLRYQLTPRASGNLEWKSYAAGRVITSPGLTLLIAQESPFVYKEGGFVSVQYGLKRAAPRVCAEAFGTNQSFLTVLYPTHVSVPRMQVFDTGICSDITISDGPRRDTWSWDYATQSMLRRTAKSSRRWQFSKDSQHG